MLKKLVLPAVFLGSIVVTSGYALHRTAATDPAPILERTDFMTGLSSPWDMAFLPDGTMFFTERCQGLSVRTSDGTVNKLFGVSGYNLEAPDLFCEGQSGMLGVAIDPEYATNGLIYVYMSSNKVVNPRTNRVIRLMVNQDFTSVSDRKDIIEDIPYKDVQNTWGGAGSHSGGRLRFGPDGFLYVTTGDNHNSDLPQNLNSLGGKILRVDRDGVGSTKRLPPAGDPRIFTYGHRNTQGLTFHPTSGRVYIAEHGPDHDDEVTPLTEGGNGGWDPKPDPGVVCADNYCGYISNKINGFLTPMTDLMKFPDAMKPMFDLVDAQGLGPATFVTGPQWKSWDGSLLISFMATMKLYILQMGQNDDYTGIAFGDLPANRMRSLVEGPDGNLYIAVDEGAIWKVIPH